MTHKITAMSIRNRRLVFHELALLALLVATLTINILMGGVVYAKPGTGDYGKNYLYKATTCEIGNKGKDLPVVQGRDDTKTYACIRLMGNNQGYTTSPLPPPNQVISNNSCLSDGGGLGGGGSSSEVYTVNGGGFGFICVTVTDATKWDFTGYKASTPNPNNNDTCANLQESGSVTNCTIADKEDPGLAGKTCSSSSADSGCGLIEKYVNPLIRLLAGLVGIIVVIMIIIGGIQYSSAGGDPSKVAAAKQRIYNAVFALIAFFLTLAFLQWLVPGGLL